MHAFLSSGKAPPHPLSLHQLSALDAPPVELIGIAGELCVPSVSLFTNVPEQARHVYPSIAPADLPIVARALAQSGVELCNIEVFPLDTDAGPERFREALELGRELGASRATAHVHEANLEQAVSRFARFAQLCSDLGMVAGLEFNAFSAVCDLRAATRIVAAAGAGDIVLDTLHLVRSGGAPADIEAVSDLIGYCQISDGMREIEEANRWREAVGARMIPGEGEFPLGRLLGALPPGTIIEIEVPQKPAMLAGVSALDRAERAVAATRRLLEQLQAGPAG